MGWIYLICNECDEEVEVYTGGDTATMCPECRSVDNFTNPEDIEEDELQNK